MEKWLVIGSGGREYSIAQKLAENGKRNVYVAPGNPMMDRMNNVITVNIDEMDFMSLIKFAQQNQIDWTIVGPEQPLSNGIVDAFRAENLQIFGPNKYAAQLESSKAFAKQIMQKKNVATATYQEFDNPDDAIEYLNHQSYPVVIKANGLAAGKGVIISNSKKEAVNAIEHLFKMSPDSEIIIEEFLKGQEFSLIVMANGTQVVPMPIAQDHKRAFNGDKGPNTGGMGAYSPVPQFAQMTVDDAMDQIIKPVLAEMKLLGHPFTGFLYAGLIQTAQGTKVVEFNVRMGDPETQVILPQLEDDFGNVIDQLMDKHNQALILPKWKQNRFWLGTIVASKGYPGKHSNYLPLPQFDDSKVLVSYSGVANVNGKVVSNGGRVLMAITSDVSVKAAQKRINADLKANVNLSDYEYRTDIGSKSFK